MERESLTNRTDGLRDEDSRRKGRPRLRREDCVKRELAGLGEGWRTGDI